MASLQIQLNGEPHQAEPGQTIASLIKSLGRHPQTVAVELNGTILPRARFSETPLHPGDQVEVVHFVQGGLDLPASPSV